MLLLHKYCDIPNTLEYKHLPKTRHVRGQTELTVTAETEKESRLPTEREKLQLKGWRVCWLLAAARGTQAPEQRRQANDQATTTTNQRVRGLTLRRPSPPRRSFSHSASSLWGVGGLAGSHTTQDITSRRQTPAETGLAASSPSSQRRGESRYVIPHLDGKESKHKAPDTELPAPTKEAKGEAGASDRQSAQGLKKGRVLPQNVLHRNTSE